MLIYTKRNVGIILILNKEFCVYNNQIKYYVFSSCGTEIKIYETLPVDWQYRTFRWQDVHKITHIK